MSSTINSITVEGTSSISVVTAGTQGLAGPNTVLGRSVADSTASTAGSLLVYDHSNTQWVDSQATAAQSLTAKLFNLQFTTGGATVTQILDEDNLGSNSNTALATQQSIKAYVDAEITAQDLDFQGDSGGALSIDLDSETLTIAGGTGLTSVGSGNTITLNIDSTVTTLTGTQTLTNKTLTAPVLNTVDINGGDISNATTINKSPVITLGGDLSGSATLTELGNATLTATIVANSVALGTDTTGNYVATVAAGEGINVSGSGSETAAVTISAEDATDSNKGVASFDSTDFTVSSGAVTLNAERVQDIVGAMVSSNTESGIAVAYQDSDGTLDFNVDDFTVTLAGDLGGSVTITDLASATLTATIQANSVALGTDTTGNYVATITASNTGIDVANSGSETAGVTLGLNTEHVQDLVGAMFSSNTESGIAVTYQDSDGTIDLDVDDFTVTLSGDVAGSGTITNLGDVTISTTVQANSVALGTDTTGNYVATIAAGEGITVSGSGSETAAVTIAAEDASDTNKGVATFDATDFTVSSGDVTLNAERVQDIVGAMVSSNTESGIAVTYEDSDGTLDFNVDDFTITLAGDLGGAVTITDLASGTLTATIQANSVALGTDTTGNYVATVADAGSGRITVANSGAESAAVTLDIANNAIGANQIANNAIALGTKTTGNYVATIADAGNSRITVANSGSETAAVTLDIANDAIGNAQIANNAVTLGTQTTGNYVATIAGTSNEISVSGSGSETAAVTIGLPSDVTIGNNLTVTGNLTVNGTTTTVNTANLDIEDATVRFAKNATTLSATDGAGLEFGGSTSKPTILWDNSESYLVSNKSFNVGGTSGTTVSVGAISLKNSGTRSRVDFYCETNNAHYARLQAPAHADFSGNVTLTLPTTTSNIVGDSATQTLTNKTINASNNTLSNIANSSLTNSSITISDGSNTTAIALGGTLTVSGTSNEVEVSESSGTVTVGLPAATQITTSLGVGGGSTNGIQISQGAIAMKNGGTQSRIDFYCESSNAHYARLQAPAHSSFSGNVTLTLPAATGTLVGSGDSGTVTNTMLAGSIANSKLANSTVSFGGVSLALGASDATPAFDLSDATNYPTSSLSGTITNAQLAGSIANSKLANSSITVTDGSNSTATALGGTITFTAGEGIDVTESSGTITIEAEDATASNKGVASFTSDFSVSSGAVSLAASGVSAGSYGTSTAIPAITVDAKGRITALSTNSISTSFTLAADSGSNDTFSTGGTLTFTGGDGIDTAVSNDTITITAEDATSSNKGVASFTGDFSVSSGAVSLASSGVSAATYGSATAIPVIAIDAKGRITSASTANISTSFTLSDGSNTQTIAGGDTFTVAGTSNEVDVAVSATDTLTIGLPNDVTISNNLTVSGNLSVTGTTTQTGSVVTDNNFTGLTNANTGNSTDFGFYGKYVESSTTKYAGLFYDASTSNSFRLFADTQTVPSTTVNTGATGYAAAGLIVGDLTASSITIGSTAVTATAAELNILDGVTSTASELNILDGVTATTAELNIMDGDTSATSTTLADADRVVVNDAGTMKQVALTDFETYFESALDTLSNVTTVGTLGSLAVTGDLTVNTNVLKVDTSNNRVGIKDATPAVTLDIGSATDAIHIPTGTTAQRPGSPSAGMLRYNTTLSRFEGHDGSSFSEIGGGGGSNTFTVNTYTSSGSAAFTLSQAPDSEDNLLVFVEGVFMNQNDYTLNGTTLTLDAAPPSGRKIVVYSVRAAVSGSNLNHDQFTCNGNSSGNLGTEFTLSISPVSENNTQVFLDGVYQQKTDYSVSGTTLTMDTAPSAGAILEVMTFTQTDINVPVNDTVDTVHLKTDAVTTAKITDGNVTRAKIAADAIDATKLADGAVSEEHLDPTIISGLSAATPVSGDSIMFLDATDSALKKADVNEIMATAVSITSAADAVAMSFDVNENATFTGTVTATGTSVFANLDISGDVDIDGTTNLDVVDIDGAVDMASTLAVGGNVTFSGTLNGITTTQSVSGNRWGVLPEVASNGVLEIGRYLDFHATDGDTSDYGARFDYDGSKMILTSAMQIEGAATLNNNATVAGVLNVGISSSAGGVATFYGTGTGSEAKVQIEGEGGADPYINFLANNTQHWSVGVDDSDDDKFKISKHSALGTNDYFTVNTAGAVTLNSFLYLDYIRGISDGNTGINIAGSDVLELQTGGSARVQVDGSGNVLMGDELAQVQNGTFNITKQNGSPVISLMSRSSTSGDQATLLFQQTTSTSGNYTATGSGRGLGLIGFRGVDAAGVAREGAGIRASQSGTAVTGAINGEMFFRTRDLDRQFIDYDGNFGYNTTSLQGFGGYTTYQFTPNTSGSKDNVAILVDDSTGSNGRFQILMAGSAYIGTRSNDALYFTANDASRLTLTNDGSLISSGKTSTNATDAITLNINGYMWADRTDGTPVFVNRRGSDGNLIEFYNDTVSVGSISCAGTTVSYNPFMGSHYSETEDADLLFGTVMETIGSLVTNHYAEQSRLPKVKISTTEDSKAVYGVWIGSYKVETPDADEDAKDHGETIAALGASWVRVRKDEKIELGDLLCSAGDGTAKVQEDDIIRSKTIGKVTSLEIKETHADGSFVVPAVLYCG